MHSYIFETDSIYNILFWNLPFRICCITFEWNMHMYNLRNKFGWENLSCPNLSWGLCSNKFRVSVTATELIGTSKIFHKTKKVEWKQNKTLPKRGARAAYCVNSHLERLKKQVENSDPRRSRPSYFNSNERLISWKRISFLRADIGRNSCCFCSFCSAFLLSTFSHFSRSLLFRSSVAWRGSRSGSVRKLQPTCKLSFSLYNLRHYNSCNHFHILHVI